MGDCKSENKFFSSTSPSHNTETESFEFISVKCEPASELERALSEELGHEEQPVLLDNKAVELLDIKKEECCMKEIGVSSNDATEHTRESNVTEHLNWSVSNSGSSVEASNDAAENGDNLNAELRSFVIRNCDRRASREKESTCETREINEQQFEISKANCLHTANMECDDAGLDSTTINKLPDVLRQLIAYSTKYPFSCEQCEKSFSRRDDLLRHIRGHNDDRPFSCDICFKSFPESWVLVRHMKTHSEERSFFCEHCENSFSRRSNLIVHLRKHTGEKPFPCNFCGKSFSQKSHLVSHLRSHSANRPYSCEHCGNSFFQRIHLVRHLRIHSGERPFACKQCGKTFTQKGTLIIHLRRHSGERPFTCGQCGKSFRQSCHLLKHARTHNGERPLSCEQCGKSFSCRTNLVTHVKTHSGERMFSCDVCKLSFFQKIHLLSHLRTHSGERPFHCEHCGMAFSQRSNLVIHERTHSGERPFSCEHCRKSFTCKANLVRHVRVHAVDSSLSLLGLEECSLALSVANCSVHVKCENLDDSDTILKDVISGDIEDECYQSIKDEKTDDDNFGNIVDCSLVTSLAETDKKTIVEKFSNHLVSSEIVQK